MLPCLVKGSALSSRIQKKKVVMKKVKERKERVESWKPERV